MSTEATRRTGRLALLACAVAAVTACGGGGSGGGGGAASPTPPAAAPAPTTVSGVVLLLDANPATVCYDTNRDGDCDAAEPTTTTDGTGAYTLTGLPPVQPVDAALVAQVPAGAGGAYTLRTPTARPAFIGGITTLVQVGVSRGLSRPDAEAAVARQLQIEATALYGDHRSLPAGFQRVWLETFDAEIVRMLREGTPLQVGPSPAVADYVVDYFYYDDYASATEHAVSYDYTTGAVDPTTGLVAHYSFDRNVRNAQPRASYSSNVPWVLHPTGWKVGVHLAEPYWRTTGNPFVVLGTAGQKGIVSERDDDASGRPLAEVVGRTADGANGNDSGYATVNVFPARTLAGTMPSGARTRTVRAVTMTRAASYWSVEDRVAVDQTSLAALMAAYPPLAAGAVATEQNTALLGRRASAWLDNGGSVQSCATQFSTNGAGLRTCIDADLRATFDPGSSTLQFHLCDYAFGGTPVSHNCRHAGTAPLVPTPVGSGTTNGLSVDPMPAVAAPFLAGRVLVENQGRIFRANPAQTVTAAPTPGTITKLNRVAMTALANALGITAPNPTFTSPSPFMGVWQLEAGLQNRCEAVVVDAAGELIGECQSPTDAVAHGSVSATGAASFAIPGFNSTYTGQFAASTATGTWSNTATLRTGPWSATRY